MSSKSSTSPQASNSSAQDSSVHIRIAYSIEWDHAPRGPGRNELRLQSGLQAREVPERTTELAVHPEPGGPGAFRQRRVGDHVRVPEQLADHNAASGLHDPAKLAQCRL